MELLLKNGCITDSMNNIEGIRDVLIKDGAISCVCENMNISADKVIDCAGLAVIPGICDMHVHLRDPGQTHKEDIVSGSRAAAAGGVTAVMCMPNTSPVLDSPELVADIVKRAKSPEVVTKVYPCASITKGLKGEELTDFTALKAAGAVAVSDDGRPVENSRIMMNAMLLAEKVGLKVVSHCEDLSIVGNGIINEGIVSERLGVAGISRTSENAATARELCFAGDLRTHIHIAHVSTKEVVGYIRSAKKRGISVTCETAPHYFTLTEHELLKRDADYRMNPPLRTPDDVVAVIKGLQDGIFDCIASDHAPHSANEKSDFEKAFNGVVGLETLLAVTLTQLYHRNGGLPLSKIVEMLCVNPRRILGIPGGGLGEGSPADIAVVDLNEEWSVEPDRLHSKSRNTCFKGMKLKGKVKYTIMNGEVVFTDGQTY